MEASFIGVAERGFAQWTCGVAWRADNRSHIGAIEVRGSLYFSLSSEDGGDVNPARVKLNPTN